MRGVPPEIDDLMWRLAEDGSPTAHREFEARHIRYAPELARRVRMVAELRQAGRAVSHRPTFMPRTPKVARTPPWVVAVVAGLLTVAVGAVAAVALSGGERTVVVSDVPRVVPSPVLAPPLVPSTLSHQDPPATPRDAKPTREETEPERIPDYRRPREVRVSETSLASAIRLVASGTGLSVTLAPGFADRRVSLDYVGLSPIDVLKAMGEQYGFSVLEEEEGRVLLIPARDPMASVRSVGP